MAALESKWETADLVRMSLRRHQILGDRDLTRIFADVGRSYGYVGVTARFLRLDPIDMRWTGYGSRSVEFEISDYLRHAPEYVLRDIAEKLFRDIGHDPVGYRECTKEYLTSDRFITSARTLYLDREGYRLALDHRPKVHDIDESIGRIESRGLFVPPDVMFAWSDALEVLDLIRLITIPEWMDSDAVPEEVFDFVVWSCVCHIPREYGLDGRTRTFECERSLSSYPDSARLKRELDMILQARMEGDISVGAGED